MQHKFLIIGAMKAGTTSLYKMLERSPDIYMPSNKEPEALISDNVYRHKERYLRLLGCGRGEKMIGEASTAYSKYPVYTGVPKRAYDVLGPDTKIIYMIRHPLARAISHLNHDLSLNRISQKDMKRLLFQDEVYALYSDYRLQLAQWTEWFEPSNIKVVKLEDLRDGPMDTIQSVFRFLGVKESIQSSESLVANRGEGKQVPYLLPRLVVRSETYRNVIKPYIPAALIRAAKRHLSDSASYIDVVLSKQEKQEFLLRCNGGAYESSAYSL